MSELLADDPAGPMTVLLQDAMDTALHLYVDKEEKDAIKASVVSTPLFFIVYSWPSFLRSMTGS